MIRLKDILNEETKKIKSSDYKALRQKVSAAIKPLILKMADRSDYDKDWVTDSVLEKKQAEFVELIPWERGKWGGRCGYGIADMNKRTWSIDLDFGGKKRGTF